jgi:hypothetical protein
MFFCWLSGLVIIMTCVPSMAQRRPISIPGIFSVMRFQNTACVGDNEEGGTCLYENDCLNKKGSVVGRCANGFAACCSFKFTCGQETQMNETLFVNRQYPNHENDTNTCQVTIKKLDNVCQLRLDFQEFTLSQPDENGFCTTDSFMVRTTIGDRLPIICGDNGGQHIYVDMGRGSANPVVLSIVTNGIKVNRKWKIKINMIPCNNLDMAPSGCLQYYRSPSEVIQSFNYGPKIEYRARYLANLRYTVCIRTEENFCAIKWETSELGSFLFGAPFEGKDSEFGGASGSLCNFDDFIGIDQGSLEGTGQGEDRFCGAKLLDHDFIISRSKPFQLKVRSNGDHFNNAFNSQTGFSLRYTQLPCVI